MIPTKKRPGIGWLRGKGQSSVGVDPSHGFEFHGTAFSAVPSG